MADEPHFAPPVRGKGSRPRRARRNFAAEIAKLEMKRDIARELLEANTEKTTDGGSSIIEAAIRLLQPEAANE